jgi:hypothetical protein
MKKIIFLILSFALFCPSFSSAFTVEETDQLSGDYIYLRKQFIDQNVFPYQQSWVQIRINVLIPTEVSHENRNKLAKINGGFHAFLSVMEENSWVIINSFRTANSQVADGILRFDEDGNVKFIITLNGKSKGIYYNSKMTLWEYFTTVNQKILRRLSNAGFISYSERQ